MQALIKEHHYCISICSEGRFANFHHIVIPFFDRHTELNSVQMLVGVLTALLSGWRDNLFSVTTLRVKQQ